MSLEQAQLALEAASREHERLAQQREQVRQSIHAIGQAYHFVDLERGVRRNGQLIASDIRTQMATIRAVAQHEHLSQRCLDRIDKAERVVPKMQATIEFVSGYVRQQVHQLGLGPAGILRHARPAHSIVLSRTRRPYSHGQRMASRFGNWLTAFAHRCLRPMEP